MKRNKVTRVNGGKVVLEGPLEIDYGYDFATAIVDGQFVPEIIIEYFEPEFDYANPEKVHDPVRLRVTIERVK